jgi:hypothetical protein
VDVRRVAHLGEDAIPAAAGGRHQACDRQSHVCSLHTPPVSGLRVHLRPNRQPHPAIWQCCNPPERLRSRQYGANRLVLSLPSDTGQLRYRGCEAPFAIPNPPPR